MAGDSTQFMIDIAAQLSGGESAAATLATLGDRMVSAGASAEQLDATVQRAAAAYEEASAAAKRAADAVTASSESYKNAQTIASYAARDVERSALKMDEVRAKLSRAIELGDVRGAEKLEAKLANLGARHEEFVGKAAAASAALDSEAAALDAAKAAAANAAATEKQMGAALKSVETAAEDAADAEKRAADAAAGSGKVNEMAEAMGRLGGPLGRAGQKAFGAADGIKKLIGSMGSAGVVAAFAVIVVAVAAAIGAAIVATLKWSVTLADAARSQGLTIEAVSRTSDSLRGLAGILPQVQAATGLATDELVGLAQQLDAAGVSAADMPAALRAVAIAEAALGKGAAAKLVEDLKAGKKTAAELAAEMEKKFGGIVAKKMLSLDAQAATLKRNLSGTFGGLNIEPFLEGLSTLVALFDSNTAAGRAMKQIFESIFQPLLDGATAAIPAIEGAFIQLEIWALKAQIALKPYMPMIGSIASGLAMIGKVAAIVAGVVLVAFAGIAIPFFAVIAAIGYVIDALVGFGESVGNVISGVLDWFASLPERISAFLSGLPSMLSEAGVNLVLGLIGGITSAGAGIISALLAPVQGGINAVKSLLGIHSPSKVFEAIGANTAAGFEGGVDDGAAGAQTALESMVEPPDPMPAAAAKAGAKAGGKAGAGAGAGFNITGNTFIFQGVQGAEDSEVRFGDLLTRFVEGDVDQLGGAEPA